MVDNKKREKSGLLFFSMYLFCLTVKSIFLTGVHGDSLTVLQSPEFVSFEKGEWPVSGEKIPDLVALTMGFSVQEVLILENVPHF